MRKVNFTLIELLTVIAIIAILSSLLLPALGKARDTAYSIACLNHTKTIVTASILYADSSDGWIIPTDFRWNTSYDQKKHWTGLLAPYGVRWSSKQKETSTFRCPAEPLKKNDDGFWNNASSLYLLNIYLCGSPRTSYFYQHRFTNILRPSETVHGGESVYSMEMANNVKNFKFRHGSGDYRIDISYSGDEPPALGTGNIFYMDGHAATKSYWGIINNHAKKDYCLQYQGFAEGYNKCGISLKELY